MKTDTAKTFGRTGPFLLQTTSSALAALKQGVPNPWQASLQGICCDGDVWCWPTLGPQLLAEIGDVRRFHSKKALVAFSVIDAALQSVK